ncbi:TonB-dependent hemoglobin/transferrin/lactoferrin family receptor [Pseudochrobactrum sp. AO18b]|uniref:TonB-dependent hemoglobin/transferrin/lactoferrin family receptor n=1 Tax=Pseudochrobactrum sp. AO18b TaxID=1201036 RepID=UPI0003A69C21|nr:TonB-dependent hemoglobin/transferrin/lactoferrin family receptor [Pseudochrobactrum sp. AO18b]
MKISQKSAFRLLGTTVLSTIGLFAFSATPLLAQTKPVKTQQQTDEQKPADKAKSQVLELDTITISPLSNDQAVIDAIASTSLISRQQIDRIQPTTAADIFRFTPGVHASLNGDDPATSINIRGLQQYGRVAVTLDGARQDYWRVGHGSGSFYIEPELLKQVTVIRGPVSNIYGSGAIGGVVAFETKDARDFLYDGETWALSEKLRYESNGKGFLTSTTGAYRFNENFDVIGNLNYRDSDEYKNGDGDYVRWTGEKTISGMGKVTLRPAEGHELKFGISRQKYEDIITGSSGSASPTLSRYNADTVVSTYTGSYTYRPDDNPFWDLSVNAYHSATDNDQFQVWQLKDYGKTRYYDVSTSGFRAHNSSRFETESLKHTVTYGMDYYKLRGRSDTDNFGNGEQQAYGGFVQWQGEYQKWLEVIGAVRYDGYKLDGTSKASPGNPSQDVSLDGNRVSPRLSVGITPIEGIQLYGLYAQGYRVPHMQDVFRQNGSHGSGYEPNLFLKPEVATTYEAGINLRQDNLIEAGDQLRTKLNIFHTDVKDYINTVKIDKYTTSENVGTARLRGVELEGTYDTWWGYVNLAASYNDAEMKDGIYKGESLSNTPLHNFSAALGLKALDDRLVYGIEYQSLGKVTRAISNGVTVYPRTDLVNVFANWQVTDNVKLDFGVDNIFNKAYTDAQTGWATTTDIEQGKGRTFKVAITGRFGG